MKNEALSNIIARLRDHEDQILSITWVGNNYSKLDLIRDLEKVLNEPSVSSYEEAMEVVRDQINYVRSSVAKRVKEIFPEFTSEVVSTVDDQQTFVVRVFNVPDNRYDEVFNKLVMLESEFSKDGSFIILISIKSVDVTKQYYPQFAQKD